MQYVIVEIAGKQYKVKPGDILEVDKINGKTSPLIFDRVLLSVDGEDVTIGKPYVDGASVSAKLLENIQGEKLRVARFTAKSRHRRVVGFRAALSKVQIEKINTQTAASKKTEDTKKDAKSK